MTVKVGNWIKFETTVDAMKAAGGLNTALIGRALHNTNKRVRGRVDREVKKSIREDYAVRARDIPKGEIERDRQEGIAALLSVRYRGQRLPIEKFNPVQRGVQRGRTLSNERHSVKGGKLSTKRYKRRLKGTGVYARIRRDEPPQPITGSRLYGMRKGIRAKAFFDPRRPGRVFARWGKKRLPLGKPTAPAAPQMITERVAGRAMQRVADGYYDTELQRQLEFQFNREFQRMVRRGRR